jgi:hypothetical protein
VTDKGLQDLKQLKKLRTLDVTKTKVTEAGINELKAAQPDLKVLR